MSFHSWLQNLRSALAPVRGHPRDPRWGSLRAATQRLNVEALEDRLTPKHGSLLNVAGCELAALSGQCLDRRIGSAARLSQVVTAWVKEQNERKVGVN